MQRETNDSGLYEKEIDGIKIESGVLLGRKSVHVLHRLGKVMSPVLSKATGLLSGQSLQSVPLEVIGPALESFFNSCSDEDLDYFMKELFSNAIVNHMPPDNKGAIDLAFKGKPFALVKAMIWILEINFGGFSQLLPVLARGQEAAKASAFPSKTD